MIPSGYLSTAVELIKLGAIGFAGVVFISVFVLLMRGKAVDNHTARLREAYLKYGVICAVVFALIGFSQTFFSASHKVSLTFSPAFDVNLLPEPTITLLGATVKPAETFDVNRDTLVVIQFDAALKRARELAQNVTSLTSATAALANTNDAVSTKLAAAVMPGPAPVDAVALSRKLEAMSAARTELKAALVANRINDVARLSLSVAAAVQ